MPASTQEDGPTPYCLRSHVNKRHDFTDATKHALAMRVAYVCSNPDCGAATAGPNSDPTKTIMVGVAAHITAAAPGGKRYNPALTKEERRHADNGIWLCQNCGKRVDDDDIAYPETLLRDWKRNAEARALANVGRTAPFGIIDSRDIVAALQTHIPDEDVHLVVGEGIRRLSSMHGVDHLSVTSQGDGLTLSLGSSENNGKRKVDVVSFTPVFPDTPDGAARQTAWDSFVRLGTPVEILASDVPTEEMPPQLQALADQYGPDFRIRLGASRKSRPLIVAMKIQNQAGLEYTFPYLDLRVISGGVERVTLSNAEQPIPFKFELGLTPTGKSDIHWSFELNSAPFYWFAEFLRFKQVVASPATAVITSLDDGLESIAIIPSGLGGEQIDAATVDLTNRVLAIQRRLSQPLRVPARRFFDEADVKAIVWFEYTVKTGRQLAPPKEIRLTASDPGGRAAIEAYEGGPLRVRIPTHVERLLDNDVNLGPVWTVCEDVHVELAKESVPGEPYQAVFLLSPSPGHNMDVIYELFAPEYATAGLTSTESTG
jgi:hypothetical protein